MRAVSIVHLPELDILSNAILELMGTNTNTLWVEVEKWPVKDIDGNLIGHFIWHEDTEDVVFRPAEV